MAAAGIATLAACATAPPRQWESPLAREHPLVGRIWAPAEGRFVEPAEVQARVGAATLLVLGEKHDNADHHHLQAELLDAFLASPGRAVVLEMVDEERQGVLDELHGDADALGVALEWERSGWPEFAIYRPIFATSLARGAELIAAGLGRSRAMSLARGTEALPEGLVARHGLATPLPAELEAKLTAEIRDGHCGLMPESMLPGMLRVQRARDATMAERMLSAKAGAALVAGAGHARRDYGVPYYLAQAGRAAVVVAFVEVDDEALAPVDYKEESGSFDLLWFTPRANDEDHCAELEKQLKGHGAPGGRG